VEEWRPVVGYEGYYEVSSEGRVKRLGRWVNAKLGGRRWWPEEITEGYLSQRGYKRVKLFSKNAEVHRLVCEAFHGPKPSPKHHAAHADDVKTNNTPANLRWATPKENADDRLRNGLQARGEAISTGRLTEAQVREIRANYVKRYGILNELVAKYGVTKDSLIDVIKRRSWTHI
jgi:hypothetical protein